MALVVLIGPSGVGKSTVGALVANRLGVAHISLDNLRFTYYAEVGYDASYAQRLRQTQGFPALVEYWKGFNAHAVIRVLADYPDAVIDFGAGHSIYDDEAEFARVSQALALTKLVVLLLPSPDAEESIRILSEIQQTQAPVQDRGIIGGLIRGLVEHPSNYRLATLTVYTHTKTPDAVCAEIMHALV